MKIRFFLFAAAVSVLASCGRSDDPETVPATVRIEPVITRATEVNFESGDRIGLTVTEEDGSVYAQNALLTYDGSSFAGDLKWYDDSGVSCSLRAFYPYSEGGFPSSFSVAADQRSGAGANDLMLATKQNCKPQEAPVAMVFKHQLSQIVMTVKNDAGITLESVTLKGLLPKVDFSFAEDGSLVAEADEAASPIDIVMEAVNPGLRYRAIVVPQKMAFSVSVKAKAGTVVQEFSEVTMKPGYTYTIEATVTAEGMAFKLSGEIQAWENGGVIGPDDPDEPVEFEEGDGYFVYDGIRYETVELPDGNVWMAEPLAFVPRGVTVSDDPAVGTVWYPYSSDGTNVTVLKDQASIEANGFLYSYDALLGAAIDETNYDKFEGAQGICPPGWHIPSRAEWFALCGSSNASKYLGESGVQTDTSAVFMHKAYGYAPVEKFDEAGFNFTLSGCIANNKYNALIADSSVCDVEAYLGKNRMAYVASSSPNSPTQMFALMTTFSSANTKGKVSLAFATLGKSGVQVRCVRSGQR